MSLLAKLSPNFQRRRHKRWFVKISRWILLDSPQDSIQTYLKIDPHKLDITNSVQASGLFWWTETFRVIKLALQFLHFFNFFKGNEILMESSKWCCFVLGTWTTTRYLKHHRGVWGWISILQRNCKQSSLIQKSYFSFYCSSFIVAWNFLHDLVYVSDWIISHFSAFARRVYASKIRDMSRESEEVSLIRNCLFFRRRKWSQDEAMKPKPFRCGKQTTQLRKRNVLETLIQKVSN